MELIGMEHVELISRLLNNRQKIVYTLRWRQAASEEEKEAVRRDILNDASVNGAALLRALQGGRAKGDALAHGAQSRLKAASPAYRQEQLLSRIHLARHRLETGLTSQLTSRSHQVQAALLRLRSSGPVETMRRGYAVLTLNGHAVRSVAELQVGSTLHIRLADGCADAAVLQVERYEDRS